MFQTTFPDLQRWLMSPPNFWSAAIVALTRGAGDSRATRPKAVNPFGSNSFAVTFLRDKNSKISKIKIILKRERNYEKKNKVYPYAKGFPLLVFFRISSTRFAFPCPAVSINCWSGVPIIQLKVILKYKLIFFDILNFFSFLNLSFQVLEVFTVSKIIILLFFNHFC